LASNSCDGEGGRDRRWKERERSRKKGNKRKREPKKGDENIVAADKSSNLRFVNLPAGIHDKSARLYI
jgi:hypothetical protein